MREISQSFRTHASTSGGRTKATVSQHYVTIFSRPFSAGRINVPNLYPPWFSVCLCPLVTKHKAAGFVLRHISFTSISKRSQIAERKEWIPPKIVKVSRLLRDSEAVGLNPLFASCSLPDYFCLLWPYNN